MSDAHLEGLPLVELKKKAEQGHAMAQCNLGTKYKEGQGLVQDYIQAHKFFNLAASNLTGLSTPFLTPRSIFSE